MYQTIVDFSPSELLYKMRKNGGKKRKSGRVGNPAQDFLDGTWRDVVAGFARWLVAHGKVGKWVGPDNFRFSNEVFVEVCCCLADFLRVEYELFVVEGEALKGARVSVHVLFRAMPEG